MTDPVRRVSASLVLDVHEPAQLVLQVAVAKTAPASIAESLLIKADGRPVMPSWVTMPHDGRTQLVQASPGRITIDYSAMVTGSAAGLPVTDEDWITYLRPSRYVESDRLAPLAAAEFAGISDVGELLAAVTDWVGSRLRYVSGSSGPADSAIDTMLSRQGVCRDYAHLVAALLRGLDVPARLVAVYAPGLSPMDFHAVVEAAVDGSWRVVDATRLARRASLVRIATGRDAADTAFLSTYGGAVDLLESRVSAVVDGPLPIEDSQAAQHIS